MYNKKLMKELGVTIPPNGQVTQAQFLDIVKKAKAAGMEPIVIGTGDRPFTGAYLTFEPMLRKLGIADYTKLLDGKLSWSDPRVVRGAALTEGDRRCSARCPRPSPRCRSPIRTPTSSGRSGLMFPQGTWYTQRAFAPADRGGQPADFELGIMTFPTVDGGACDNCDTWRYRRRLRDCRGHQESRCRRELPQGDGHAGDGHAVDVAQQQPERHAVRRVEGDEPATGLFRGARQGDGNAKYFIGIPNQHLTGAAATRTCR